MAYLCLVGGDEIQTAILITYRLWKKNRQQQRLPRDGFNAPLVARFTGPLIQASCRPVTDCHNTESSQDVQRSQDVGHHSRRADKNLYPEYNSRETLHCQGTKNQDNIPNLQSVRNIIITLTVLLP